uniref:DNA2/NAM7 helicase-like C-terminal domain-containing protein n=1 Tax=Panagrolaimus superbus TaxID=310955 RepID=A0A914YKK4_9BILA
MEYKQNNECERIRELKESDIGVVTPYKDNVNEIKYQLSQLYPKVTVGSVEKYQGSEKAVIIFSAVRTEGIGFLSDP